MIRLQQLQSERDAATAKRTLYHPQEDLARFKNASHDLALNIAEAVHASSGATVVTAPVGPRLLDSRIDPVVEFAASLLADLGLELHSRADHIVDNCPLGLDCIDVVPT